MVYGISLLYMIVRHPESVILVAVKFYECWNILKNPKSVDQQTGCAHWLTSCGHPVVHVSFIFYCPNFVLKMFFLGFLKLFQKFLSSRHVLWWRHQKVSRNNTYVSETIKNWITTIEGCSSSPIYHNGLSEKWCLEGHQWCHRVNR